MVPLLETFNQDFKTAFKARDEVKVSVLRMLKTVVKNKEVELRRELEEPEVIGLVKTQVKQRKDSIEQFEKGGRDDLAAREKAELAVLEAYLPAQLPLEEVERVVGELIEELGASSVKDLGRVMKAVMGRFGGQVDGKVASDVVKRKLTA